MATDRLINQTQGEDIIDKLNEIASNVGDIKFGPQVQSSNVVSMTGYAKASTADAISQGDTLNEAVGKLEKKADDNASAVADKIDKLTSATAGDIATVTATGEIADSTVAIENTLSDSSDAKVPTSKAVGTYVAGKGYAVGVSSSTANHIVTFNGTNGKTLKDSGVTVATTADTTKDTEVPTSKAVNTLVSNKGYAVGVSSSTADHIVTFNSTDGKALKDSGYTVNTTLTNVATDIPTGSAVSTALSGKVAGPGSSTNNDIMLFSGTTGKVASDSGVQIETNTSFSDTSDAKIPTSKSIAQNVAGKAVLKNYAVATAQETISASTTIRDAVEQLDYRTTTNQNSISSVQNDVTEINNSLVEVIDTGAKNLLPQVTYNKENYGVKVVPNSDGGYNVSITGSSTSDFYYQISDSRFDDCIKLKLPVGNYVLRADNSSNNIYVYISLEKNGSVIQTDIATSKNGSAHFAITTTDYDCFRMAIYIKPGTTGSYTINPMICTKSQFDISPTYEPYALGNQYLTPALIEQVDSGAKNKATISSGSTTAPSRWYEIPVTGLTVGETYVVYFGSITSTDTDNTRCQAVFLNDSTECSAWMHFDRDSNQYLSVKITNNPTKLRVYAADSYATSENDTLTFSNLMVCTKAAWDVSQKFVSYRGQSNPTAYMQPTKDEKITVIDWGGYVVLPGNVCLFNIRCVVGTAIDAYGTLFTGLPKPIGNLASTAAALRCTSNVAEKINLRGDGTIVAVDESIPVGTLLLSGTYLCK